MKFTGVAGYHYIKVNLWRDGCVYVIKIAYAVVHVYNTYCQNILYIPTDYLYQVAYDNQSTQSQMKKTILHLCQVHLISHAIYYIIF
jgi:hypothetical protein